MSNQNRKLPIDTQFDYDKLIDMKAEQLEDIVKECEINMERLRVDIVKNYQMAQPFLMQMRSLKQQLKKVSEKLEASKTFLSMEKNGSLVSNIDLSELKTENIESIPPIQSKTKFKSQLVTNWVNKNKETLVSKNTKTPLKKYS